MRIALYTHTRSTLFEHSVDSFECDRGSSAYDFGVCCNVKNPFSYIFSKKFNKKN